MKAGNPFGSDFPENEATREPFAAPIGAGDDDGGVPIEGREGVLALPPE